MSDFTMYHNPKCSKSRQTLELLKEKNISPIIKEYLNTGFSSNEVEFLIDSLGDDASKIIRVKEEEFKANPFDINSKEEVIKALIKTPKLLERPILVRGNQAVIGRPPEDVLRLL